MAIEQIERTGRVRVGTGGSRSIGKTIAFALAASGAATVQLVMLLVVMVFGFIRDAGAKEIDEPRTAEAVIADDQAWSKAEETGDANYVDTLLLPNYRSISSDGSTHDKASILAHTVAGGKSGETAAKVERWRAAHPYRTSVEINGDVAILTFLLDQGPEPRPIMSCDIFVYRSGHWRALYSQHTEAGK